MVALLNNLKINEEKTLIIVKEYNENVLLAARNLQNLVIVLPSEVSVLDLISTNKILVESAALEQIKEALK